MMGRHRFTEVSSIEYDPSSSNSCFHVWLIFASPACLWRFTEGSCIPRLVYRLRISLHQQFLLPSSDSGYNLLFHVYGDLHLGHPHDTDPLNGKRLIDVMLYMKECIARVLIKRCCNP